MKKKGIIVTLMFGASTAIQLVSQIVITRFFGASLNLDIFLAAVTLPTILVTVIYATLSDSFIPLFGEKKTNEPNEADNYFFSHLIMIALFSFVVATILAIVSPFLSQLFFQARGPLFVKSVSFQMRYLFFGIPLGTIATLLGSYFYTHKDFLRFPFVQFLGNSVNVILIIFFSKYFGIWVLVVGFLGSLAIQIVLLVPQPILRSNMARISLFPLASLWIPAIISSTAARSDMLLVRSFGVSLDAGYLVYLNLVTKIFSLSTGVMTIGIQVILLPHLVEYLAKKDFDLTFFYVKKAKIYAIILSACVVIAILLAGPLVIQLLFIGNKFTPQDAFITSNLLPLFVIPALGWGINSVFFQPLIALRKQRDLAILNLAAFGASWAVGSFLLPRIGPISSIITSLIILIYGGIIGSELLWQHYKKELQKNQPPQS